MSIVVSDSSPLIALCYLKQECLLSQLFGKVLIPPAVVLEIARPHYQMGGISADSIAGVEIRSLNDQKILSRIPTELDPGERHAMALAVETEADYLLIDEIAGRQAAQSLNIRIVGTCGVLTLAKQNGLIQSIRPLLDQFRSGLNFYVSDALYRRVLMDAGETP